MGGRIIDHGSHRHDTVRIDGFVAGVVVRLDVGDVDGPGDAGMLVQVPGVVPEIRVIDEPAQVALEMPEIHRVEAHQGREQTPVRLGDRGAEQIPACRQALLEKVERAEQFRDGFLVGFLGRRETGPVDAVVDGAVDALV